MSNQGYGRNPYWAPEYTNQKPSFNNMGAFRLNEHNELNDGLVAWWLMNEGAGTKIRDIIQGIEALLIGAVSWGVFHERILEYTGGENTAEVLDARTALLKWTIYVKVTPDSLTGNPALVSRQEFLDSSVAKVNYYLQLLTDGSIESGFNIGSSWKYGNTASGVVSANNTYDICSTFDGTYLSIYVNGIRMGISGNLSAFSPPVTGTQYLDIGLFGFNPVMNPLDGKIHRVALYKNALSDHAIKGLFSTPYGTPSNPRFIVQGARTWFVPSGGGGTTYNENLMLNAELGFTPSNSLSFSKSLSFGMSAGQSPSALRTMPFALSLATQADQSESALMNMLTALTLAAEAGTTQSALMQWIAALALESQADTSQGLALDRQGAVTLGADAGFSPSVIANLLESLTLAGAAGLTPAGNLVMLLTKALDAQATIATSAGAQIYIQSISLSTQAGIDAAAQRFLATTLGVDVVIGLDPSTEQVIAAQLALQIDADILALSQMAATALLSMGMQAQFVPSVTHSFEVSLAMGIEAALSATAITGGLLGEILRTRAKHTIQHRALPAIGYKATPVITGYRARLVE